MQSLRTLIRLVSANWSFAAPLAPRVARIRAPRYVRQGSWPDQTGRRPSRCCIPGEVGGGGKSLQDSEPKLPIERVHLVWTMYVRVHRVGLQ
jgi:hypothetical protein